MVAGAFCAAGPDGLVDVAGEAPQRVEAGAIGLPHNDSMDAWGACAVVLCGLGAGEALGRAGVEAIFVGSTN